MGTLGTNLGQILIFQVGRNCRSVLLVHVQYVHTIEQLRLFGRGFQVKEQKK
jgi:hypothetical protein